MAEPQTVNIGLIVPNTGDIPGLWGANALNPDFVALDGYFGGIQTISLSNVPVTLTSPAAFTPTPSGGPTQAQNAVLKLSGTLTSNVTITLPLPGYYVIDSSGLAAAGIANGFNVILRAIGSGLIIGVSPGNARHVYNDGTNVYYVGLPDIGTYVDYANAALAGWVAVCTVPPFLLCNGSTFNAVTYPILNVILGGNTLPDFRGRSPYFLNGGTGRLTTAGAGIDGNTPFAAGGSNGVPLAVNQVPSISASGTVTVFASGSSSIFVPGSTTANTFNPNFNFANPGGAGNIVPALNNTWAQITSWSGSNSLSYTNSSQVPIGSTTPGVVGGIRMIRAG